MGVPGSGFWGGGWTRVVLCERPGLKIWGFGVQGLGFGMQGAGSGASGVGCRVWGLGVWGWDVWFAG